jgi:hypothetical protein
MCKGAKSAVIAEIDYDEFKVLLFFVVCRLFFRLRTLFFVWCGLVLGCEAVLAKRASLVP